MHLREQLRQATDTQPQVNISIGLGIFVQQSTISKFSAGKQCASFRILNFFSFNRAACSLSTILYTCNPQSCRPICPEAVNTITRISSNNAFIHFPRR